MHSSNSKTSQDENFKTVVWWSVLASIASFNCLLWAYTYNSLLDSDDLSSYTQRHLFLSGIYTVVCAYRSILPRIDLERTCLFDTQWSSIFLGRASATIAEISFAAQLALLLHEWSTRYDHVLSYWFSYLIVPLLTTAQGCCWYGLLSQNHLAHAVEESIWAMTVGGMCVLFVPFILYESGHVVWQALLGVLMSVVYCTFMITVDVPMYLTRWRENEKMRGKKNILYSVKDSWRRRVVTKDWNVWKPEVAWLTGYFSCAVWTSIALCHVTRY